MERAPREECVVPASPERKGREEHLEGYRGPE
jgi:hypothetical protein